MKSIKTITGWSSWWIGSRVC